LLYFYIIYDSVFSRNYFSVNLTYVKLDEKAIGWIIREKKKGTPTKEITEIENVTPRRVIDYKRYRETGRIPELRNPGRPRKELSDGETEAIKEAYEEYRCNAIVLQIILRNPAIP